jgi:hypothetical protein
MTTQYHRRIGSFVAAIAAIGAIGAAFPGHAHAQNNYGNPNLQCPHGQWLRNNFYTTWPNGTPFLAEDRALCNQHLRSDIFGLGCHGEQGGVLVWDNPGGGHTFASNQFTRRFCASPGVQNSQEGFLFACRGANPGPAGNMSETSIAWFASRTGLPVTGATEYLSVSQSGNLTVRGWNPAGTARTELCGNVDSFITAIPYRNRNTGLFNPLDCEFVVQPADQLAFFGALTANANTGVGTCTHMRCGPALSGLPCYGANRVGVPGRDYGEFLRPQGWHSEAPLCGRSAWPGRIGTVGFMLPGCYVQGWEMAMQVNGTPNAPVPPDVMLAMAFDVPGTCLGAAIDAGSIPVMAIQNQWHTLNQDYYYGNNLPVPPRYQINRGSSRDQQQSWEMLQMLRGNRTIDYNGNIVPHSALRGPGRCGGGDVRANRVDPPYDEGDGTELAGCATATPAGAGSALGGIVLCALAMRRRRSRRT